MDTPLATSLRDFTDEWAGRSPSPVDDIYAPEFEGHGFPLGWSVSRAQCRTLVRWFQRSVPDCEIELERLGADSEHVHARWTFTGTHTEPLGGIPSSGATVTFSGRGRHAHDEGAITEVWVDVEWWRLYAQLLRGYLRAGMATLRRWLALR